MIKNTVPQNMNHFFRAAVFPIFVSWKPWNASYLQNFNTLIWRQKFLRQTPMTRSYFNETSDSGSFLKTVILSFLSNVKRAPVINYLFIVNNRNTRKRYNVCSKLTVRSPEQHSIPYQYTDAPTSVSKRLLLA